MSHKSNYFVIAAEKNNKKYNGVSNIILSVGVVLLFFVFAIFSTYTADTATPPTIITYQGKLLQSGNPVTSTQPIGFLLYDSLAGGNLLYTASGTLPATATISVTPSSGIFSVNLGDGLNTNAVSSTIFADNSALYLEVWVNGTKLNPRKRLTSAAYAINSEYLLGISTAVSGTSRYIPHSDDNGNFVFSGLTQSSAVSGGTIYINPSAANADDTLFGIALNGSERFRVDEGGNTWISGGLYVTGTLAVDTDTLYVSSSADRVGINNAAPTAALDVTGDVVVSGTTTINDMLVVNGKTPQLIGSYVSSTILSDIQSVFVSGDYAYAVANGSNTLSVFNVKNKANPVLIESISDNDPQYKLSGPRDIFVSGNYAYITLSGNTSSLAIYDVSNPKNISMVSTLDDTVDRVMGDPKSLFVSGNYVYFTSFNDNGISIIDVSDPENPSYVSGISDMNDLGGAQGVFVSGKYAYVAARMASKLSIIDVSDPVNPTIVGGIFDGDNGAILKDATDVFVRDGYAYVAANDVDGALTVIDVTNPTNPTYVDHVVFKHAESIFVTGNRVYVSTYYTDGIYVIDVSDPTNISTEHVIPTVFGVAPAGNLIYPRKVFVAGNYLYVATEGIDKLEIYDISGAKISNAEIGNVKTDSLQVQGQTALNSSVYIRGGLSVGNEGALINGNLSLSAPSNNISGTNTISLSHTGYFITNVPETEQNAYIFDTKKTIFNGAANYLFSVRNAGTPVFSISTNGDVHTTGTFYGAAAAVSTPGNPGDLAERVDIRPGEIVEPGDVMIVDVLGTDRYRKSDGAFSAKVAGVISTRPTITLGDGKTEHTAVMALVGRVPVNVTNQNGAIKRGDLLVTASTTGHAMKYDPANDKHDHAVGVIGIALESLDGDSGKVLTLVRSGWINNRYETIAELQQSLALLAGAIGENIVEKPEELAVEINNEGLLVNISKDLNLNGNYIVNVAGITGVKSDWKIDSDGRFVTNVETREGDKALYALQSGQTEYVFSGSNQLNAGERFVDFDNITKDIIGKDTDMKVTVTLTGNANGVYVSEKTADGFMVKELLGGKSNATFDWVVIASRRLGPLEFNQPAANDIIEEAPPEEIPADQDQDQEDLPLVEPPVEPEAQDPAAEEIDIEDPALVEQNENNEPANNKVEAENPAAENQDPVEENDVNVPANEEGALAEDPAIEAPEEQNVAEDNIIVIPEDVN